MVADPSFISPAPQDAPALPQRWRTLGAPTAVFTYRDGQGGILRYVLRFDSEAGGKTIRPVTLWRNARGQLF